MAKVCFWLWILPCYLLAQAPTTVHRIYTTELFFEGMEQCPKIHGKVKEIHNKTGTYVYNAQGKLIKSPLFSYVYDTTGKMIGANNAEKTLLYTYHSNGLLATVEQRTAHDTSLSVVYYNSRSLVDSICGKGRGGESRGSTTFVYDAQNRPTDKVVRSANDEIYWEEKCRYDDMGRIVYYWYNMPSFSQQQRIYTYNSQGYLATQQLLAQESCLIGSGRFEAKYGYDRWNRLVVVEDNFPSFNPNNQNRKVLEYNKYGNCVKVIQDNQEDRWKIVYW